MKFTDIDITEILRDALPVDSFLFNPSIAHVTGNTYIISVRSYIHDITKDFDYNPQLMKNNQHPWGTDWSGTDVTYILPIIITENYVQPITTGQWPLVIPVQDMRVFRFVKDSTKVGFVVTFNELYTGHRSVLIKGGDTCDKFCYLIGWGYLLIDINDLSYAYTPGSAPMCMNISAPVEKNWSLWTVEKENKIYLMMSYAIAPNHNAFSLTLDGICDGEMFGASTCQMITPRFNGTTNIFGKLEKYYDDNLYVSLSTPAYKIDDNTYQAVGHLKVKIKYIKKLAKSNEQSQLAKFAREYIKGRGKKHFNPNYIYLMFIYHFELMSTESDKKITKQQQQSGVIELTNTKTRMLALVTKTTPAFVNKVDEYDYFLNFPSGMTVDDEHTIISYGDGDATAHLLKINNTTVNKMLRSTKGLSAKNFRFMHGEKDFENDIITI